MKITIVIKKRLNIIPCTSPLCLRVDSKFQGFFFYIFIGLIIILDYIAYEIAIGTLSSILNIHAADSQQNLTHPQVHF